MLVSLLALAVSPACARASRPGVAGRIYAVRGIRMYVEIEGHGPPLLLLHGGMGNGMQFSNQRPALRAYHRLIVPDLCAQGRTSDRPGPLTYHAMAEDVVALLDRLGVRRADALGWSDGGIVALDIAIHHPDRLRRIVTLGANFTPDGMNPADRAWSDTASAASLGPDARAAYARLSPDPADFDSAMDKIIAMWRTQPNFTLDQLRHIRARVMVAAGEHDVVRPEHTRALARAIPRARLWIVPGASHSVMFERPAVVNRTVLEFLEGP